MGNLSNLINIVFRLFNYLIIQLEMEALIKKIELSSSKELGTILNDVNRNAFMENNWDVISVKASYSSILSKINDEIQQCLLYLNYGNSIMEVEDLESSESYVLKPEQALTNLRLSKDFFENPPIVNNPNSESLKIKVDNIDWNKPVYTIDELKTLLKVSDNTLRKWLDGWISYTQMDGSDKKFILKESLIAFLKNPKIFYPSSK